MNSRIFGAGIALVVALQTSAAVARPSAHTPVKLAEPAAFKARTSLGQPNLEGMWSANFLLTFEATEDAPGLVVSEAEAKVLTAARVKKATAFFQRSLDPETPDSLLTIDGLPVVRGERRTRLVTLPADGRLPYTAAARKELSEGGPEDKADNPEDRPNSERCLVGDSQPPLTSFTFGNQLQILQIREAVVIHTEYGDDVRTVPFAEKHGSPAFASKLGDSIAQWDGDTLVVETIRQPESDRIHFWPILIVSGDATVVERFTRVSAKEMLYQFTVIDPKIYAAPWSAEFSWYATDKPMYEHACHEGNYSLTGILAGARHDEAAAKAKASGTAP